MINTLTLEEELKQIEDLHKLNLLDTLISSDKQQLFSAEAEVEYLKKLFLHLKEGYVERQTNVVLSSRLKDYITWAACFGPANSKLQMCAMFILFMLDYNAVDMAKSADPHAWSILNEHVNVYMKTKDLDAGVHSLSFFTPDLFDLGFLDSSEKHIADQGLFLFHLGR